MVSVGGHMSHDHRSTLESMAMAAYSSHRYAARQTDLCETRYC